MSTALDTTTEPTTDPQGRTWIDEPGGGARLVDALGRLLAEVRQKSTEPWAGSWGYKISGYVSRRKKGWRWFEARSTAMELAEKALPTAENTALSKIAAAMRALGFVSASTQAQHGVITMNADEGRLMLAVLSGRATLEDARRHGLAIDRKNVRASAATTGDFGRLPSRGDPNELIDAAIIREEREA